MADFTPEEISKLNARDSFLIPKSIIVLLRAMTMEEKGITITAIIDFVETGETMKFKEARNFPSVALDEFIRQYTRDREKYIETCRKNSKNAKKRYENS